MAGACGTVLLSHLGVPPRSVSADGAQTMAARHRYICMCCCSKKQQPPRHTQREAPQGDRWYYATTERCLHPIEGRWGRVGGERSWCGPQGQGQSLASRCTVRGRPLQRPQPAEPALERVLTTPRTPTASRCLRIHPPRTRERVRARARASCLWPHAGAHLTSAITAAGLRAVAPMAALDSLDSLTDADRQHLAPFLHAGPTSARSTAF